MLRFATLLLLAAMTAALFGFGLFGGVASDPAKALCVLFAVGAVTAFIADAFRGPVAEPA